MQNNKWGDLEDLKDKQIAPPTLLKLDTLSLNGNTGEWEIKSSTKNEAGEYETKNLGKEPLKVIVLKNNRKKLVSKINFKISSGEYSDKTKPVMLFNWDTKTHKMIIPEVEHNIPAQEGGSNYKTVYCIYVLLDGQLLRLQVGGLKIYRSDKEAQDYFRYLNLFTNNTFSFQFYTKLQPVLEKTKLGNKYALDWILGNEVEDDKIDFIKETVRNINDNIKANDEYMHSFKTNIAGYDKIIEANNKLDDEFVEKVIEFDAEEIPF